MAFVSIFGTFGTPYLCSLSVHVTRPNFNVTLGPVETRKLSFHSYRKNMHWLVFAYIYLRYRLVHVKY